MKCMYILIVRLIIAITTVASMMIKGLPDALPLFGIFGVL